ncbi:hypothetical protein RYX36_034390, partial [Vicia faba]
MEGSKAAPPQPATLDTQGFRNNRKITAFIGDLDLCDDKYDTSEHTIFYDLDTLFQNDFHNPTFQMIKDYYEQVLNTSILVHRFRIGEGISKGFRQSKGSGQTMSKMYNIVADALAKAGISECYHPQDYLNFYCPEKENLIRAKLHRLQLNRLKVAP